MDNPGLPEPLWRALDRRLWHATSPDRLEDILRDGEVAITGDRYRNSLCRSLDCVALFDFGPTAVDTGDQFRNWSGWFGHQQNSRVAIWLEIGRLATSANLIEAGEMRAIWHDGNLCKQYIPGVEAGHRGPIRLGFLTGALLIDAQDRSRFRYQEGVEEALLAEVDRFENTLPTANGALEGATRRGLHTGPPRESRSR